MHVKSRLGAGCGAGVSTFSVLSYLVTLFLVCALPMSAQITYQQPANNAVLVSPFSVNIDAANCNGLPVQSTAVNIDNLNNIPGNNGSSFSNTAVYATWGVHNLNVTLNNTANEPCNSTIPITIAVSNPNGGYANNSTYGAQTLGTWYFENDSATVGSATEDAGSNVLVSSPVAVDADARVFIDSTTDGGGVRYSVKPSVMVDKTDNTFVVDQFVYIAQGSSFANLEMDLNWVQANGDVVIMGFQCAGAPNGSAWQYTYSKGVYPNNTGTGKGTGWKSTGIKCDPMNQTQWSTDTWHEFTIQYQITGSGATSETTYQGFALDGNAYALNIATPTLFPLKWANAPGSLIPNFQLDGHGNAVNELSTVYLDGASIYGQSCMNNVCTQ
jgi:hypothetical protein